MAWKIALTPQKPFPSVNRSARWKLRIIEKCTGGAALGSLIAVMIKDRRGTPAAQHRERRDRPLRSHLLLAAAQLGAGAGARLRGGAHLQQLQPAPGGARAAPRRGRVRLLGGAAARVHDRGAE